MKLSKLLSLMQSKSKEGNVRISTIVVTYMGQVVQSPVRSPTLENSNPLKNSRELVEYLNYIVKDPIFEQLINVPKKPQWEYVIPGIPEEIQKKLNQQLKSAEEAYYTSFPEKRFLQEKPQRGAEDLGNFSFDSDRIKTQIQSPTEDVIVIGAGAEQLEELRTFMGRKRLIPLDNQPYSH